MKVIWFPLVLAGMVGMTGCGRLDEDTYPAQFAPQICQKHRKCTLGYFESEFSDMNDCVDEVTEDLEDLVDFFDDAGCNLEEDQAHECLVSLGQADCEDWFEGDGDYAKDCEDQKIWDC